MFVDVETLTPAEQRILGHLIVMTHGVPPAQSPRFVYHSRSRNDGLLRHPVMPSLQAPVEVSALMELHKHDLLSIAAEVDGTIMVSLTSLGLDMRDPLRAAQERQRATANSHVQWGVHRRSMPCVSTRSNDIDL